MIDYDDCISALSRYKLMLDCWRMSPKDRPTFCDIIEDLTPDLPESFRDNSFYYTMGSDEDDDDDDFTSAGSNTDAVKDDVIGCLCDDDNDDSDLIHSKTPLHPAKSSDQDHALPNDSAIEPQSPDMITNSRGFLMPVRLAMTSSSSGVLPSPVSGRRSVSGSSAVLDDRTSLSDLDLREGVVRRGATPTKQPHLPPYKREAETPNDTLSDLDRSPANHRSFGGLNHQRHGGDSQPDVVRAGLLAPSAQDGSKAGSHSPHKNGLVNGLMPPPYTYRTSPTC